MARIKLKLEGFDELLKKIESAGGSINKAVDSCMKQSAETMDNELRTQMRKVNADRPDHDLIKDMPKPEIKWEGNSCTAKVGYKLGQYNPKDLNDGYKALFLNYGTPRRKPSQEAKREYVKKAKRKATPLIKKQQEETLNKILGRLK